MRCSEKRIMITALTLLLFSILSADLNINIQTEEPVISRNKFESSQVLRKEGEPMVQYLSVQVLIPFSEKIDKINIELSDQEIMRENVYLDFARPQTPISAINKPAISRNDIIYTSSQPYPAQNYDIMGTQRYKGYDILYLRVYPYKYIPLENRISYSAEVNINIETITDTSIKQQRNLMLIDDTNTRHEIAEMVVNPSEIDTYQKEAVSSASRYPDPAHPYSMIIITDETRMPYFEEFIDWKNAQGISTGLFLTTQIYTEYGGVDAQERIRNFIIDAYITYSDTDTPLEYVFLGGDDEIIPIRGCYGEVGPYTDESIPCDMYYSALDGNWNSNGNNVYGETNDAPDLAPEVAIGRIPAETEQEFERFFHKTYYYTDVQSFSNNIAYMYGESLDSETLGSLSKDNIIPFIPEEFMINTLYERDGTYNATNVQASINSGMAIINHLGHANQTFVFNVTNLVADQFYNTEYGFAFSQGCYPAAFDEATSQQGEAVGEHLVFAEGGLYAFVGNTRYGWYSPGTTEGASQFFDLAFFDALFTQNLRQLGKALTRSKIMLIDEVLGETVMRWCDYELILFGDPSISVKDAIPGFPLITATEVEYNDDQGDGDGSINPGETIGIQFTLQNHIDWYTAYNVTATLEFLNETIDTPSTTISFGTIVPGQSVQNIPAYEVDLPMDLGEDAVEFLINVHAEGADGQIFEKSYLFSFVINLMQTNWPWFTGNSIKAAPIICDFNDDNEIDVLVSDVFANVNNFNYMAVQQDGFPLQNNENILKSIAMADMNNDGTEDFIFASLEGRVFCQDTEGNEIFSYDCAPQLMTPVIADVNGDGNPDVISLGQDKRLLVIDNEGNTLDYFPIELDQHSLVELSAADLNNDNRAEIIVGTQDGLILVINSLGQNIPGFPVSLQNAVTGGVIVLDNKNIVAGSVNKMHMISSQGDIIFSKTLTSNPTSPIAADYNEDGLLDIAFATNMGAIYIIDQQGSDLPGFPVNTGRQINFPPLAIDLNGNGMLDVTAFSIMSDLFAYEADGTIIPITPLYINLSNSTPATAGDIDLDGDLELISGLNNGVLIIDSKYPAVDDNPWTMYRGNRKRTGFYDDAPYVSGNNNSVETPIVKLYQNYPNPFTSTGNNRSTGTTITFDLPKNDKVSLDIFNLKGQKVNSLINNEIMDSGNHMISWTGLDMKGKETTSGIYLYRLKTTNNSVTRKMLLIK